MVKCIPLDTLHNEYLYCPSFGASILFSVLFCLTTLAHIGQAIIYRKAFSWVLIMSGAWQVGAFVLRDFSIQHPTESIYYDPHYVLVLLAPLWTNAFCFMCLARLVYFYIPSQGIAKIKASWMSFVFVVLDIISFIVQLYGALHALSKDAEKMRTGLHIYTGGVAMQQFFICVFLVLAVLTLIEMRRGACFKDTAEAQKLIFAMFLALSLITIRIVYRIIEYSGGDDTNKVTLAIQTHEWYEYVFDHAPMLLAILLFHYWHPGKALQGPESEFPSCAAKRRMKKERKMMNKGGMEMDVQSV